MAAVDIPAYDQTSITARSYLIAEAEKERAEVRETERQKKKLKFLLEV